MFEMLASHGLTQGILEAIVIFGGLAIIIAFFWRMIVIGAGVILVVMIILNHQDPTTAAAEAKPAVKTEAQIKADRKEEFMKDCLGIAANDKDQCELIWQEKEPE